MWARAKYDWTQPQLEFGVAPPTFAMAPPFGATHSFNYHGKIARWSPPKSAEYEDLEYINYMWEHHKVYVPSSEYRVPDPTMAVSYGEFAKFAHEGFEPPVLPEVASTAFECLYDMFKNIVPSGYPLRTYQEALRKAELSTSPGLFYTISAVPVQTKAAAILAFDHERIVGDLLQQIRKVCKDGGGLLPPLPYASSLKREVRKHMKNCREFLVGGLDLYFLKMMYFDGLLDALVQHNSGTNVRCPPFSTWYFPGNHHFHGRWKKLASRLLATAGTRGFIICYDFSGWDRSVKNHWTDAVLNLCQALLREQDRGNHNLAVMFALHRYMTNGLVVMEDGHVYETEYGVKSGDVVTTGFNSLAHILLVFTILLTMALRAGVPLHEAQEQIRRGIWFQMSGDDGVGAYDPNIVPWFSQEAFRLIAEEFGFRFKDAKSLKFVSPIDFVSPRSEDHVVDFCSKTFNFRPDGVYAAPNRLKMRCKFAYGAPNFNAKDCMIRALSYRREVYGDPVLFREIDGYVNYYFEAHRDAIQYSQPGDKVTTAEVMSNWDSEMFLKSLHTGFESKSPVAGL